MGWAQDGAVTSSIVRTATMIGTGGPGGEELESESVTACCVDAVPGPVAVAPGPSSEFPGLGATMGVPGLPVGVPVPPAWFPKSDPTASESGGTKMESDSGHGLRRRWRETPAGIACRVDPTRARASACMLSARGT